MIPAIIKMIEAQVVNNALWLFLTQRQAVFMRTYS